MLNKPNSLEEIIINYLKNGPKKTVAVVERFTKNRTFTKQGIYKILRHLKEEEIITINKKEVSLSSIWLRKMADFFALSQYYYKQTTSAPAFLSIADNEKLNLFCKTLEELDIFTAHVLYLITQIIPQEEAIFAYNYHQWFYYGRKENDEFLSQNIEKRGHPLLLLLGDNNKLDTAVRQAYNKGNSRCHILERKLFPDNYYCSFLGDFLIEFYIDKKVNALLENFYKKNIVFNKEAQTELLNILQTKGKNKLVISKNKNKINKLKKMFKKYFYIPK